MMDDGCAEYGTVVIVLKAAVTLLSRSIENPAMQSAIDGEHRKQGNGGYILRVGYEKLSLKV
jgi:hypothetical protein